MLDFKGRAFVLIQVLYCPRTLLEGLQYDLRGLRNSIVNSLICNASSGKSDPPNDLMIK